MGMGPPIARREGFQKAPPHRAIFTAEIAEAETVEKIAALSACSAVNWNLTAQVAN